MPGTLQLQINGKTVPVEWGGASAPTPQDVEDIATAYRGQNKSSLIQNATPFIGDSSHPYVDKPGPGVNPFAGATATATASSPGTQGFGSLGAGGALAALQDASSQVGAQDYAKPKNNLAGVVTTRPTQKGKKALDLSGKPAPIDLGIATASQNIQDQEAKNSTLPGYIPPDQRPGGPNEWMRGDPANYWNNLSARKEDFNVAHEAGLKFNDFLGSLFSEIPTAMSRTLGQGTFVPGQSLQSMANPPAPNTEITQAIGRNIGGFINPQSQLEFGQSAMFDPLGTLHGLGQNVLNIVRSTKEDGSPVTLGDRVDGLFTIVPIGLGLLAHGSPVLRAKFADIVPTVLDQARAMPKDTPNLGDARSYLSNIRKAILDPAWINSKAGQAWIADWQENPVAKGAKPEPVKAEPVKAEPSITEQWAAESNANPDLETAKQRIAANQARMQAALVGEQPAPTGGIPSQEVHGSGVEPVPKAVESPGVQPEATKGALPVEGSSVNRTLPNGTPLNLDAIDRLKAEWDNHDISTGPRQVATTLGDLIKGNPKLEAAFANVADTPVRVLDNVWFDDRNAGGEFVSHKGDPHGMIRIPRSILDDEGALSQVLAHEGTHAQRFALGRPMGVPKGSTYLEAPHEVSARANTAHLTGVEPKPLAPEPTTPAKPDLTVLDRIGASDQRLDPMGNHLDPDLATALYLREFGKLPEFEAWGNDPTYEEMEKLRERIDLNQRTAESHTEPFNVGDVNDLASRTRGKVKDTADPYYRGYRKGHETRFDMRSPAAFVRLEGVSPEVQAAVIDYAERHGIDSEAVYARRSQIQAWKDSGERPPANKLKRASEVGFEDMTEGDEGRSAGGGSPIMSKYDRVSLPRQIVKDFVREQRLIASEAQNAAVAQKLGINEKELRDAVEYVLQEENSRVSSETDEGGTHADAGADHGGVPRSGSEGSGEETGRVEETRQENYDRSHPEDQKAFGPDHWSRGPKEQKPQTVFGRHSKEGGYPIPYSDGNLNPVQPDRFTARGVTLGTGTPYGGLEKPAHVIDAQMARFKEASERAEVLRWAKERGYEVYPGNGKQPFITDAKGQLVELPDQIAAKLQKAYGPNEPLNPSPSKLRDLTPKEALQAAQKRILDRRNELGSGLGSLHPDDLKDLAIVGKSLVQMGFDTVEKFTGALVQHVGEWIRPHAQELWDHIQGDRATGVERQVDFGSRPLEERHAIADQWPISDATLSAGPLTKPEMIDMLRDVAGDAVPPKTPESWAMRLVEAAPSKDDSIRVATQIRSLLEDARIGVGSLGEELSPKAKAAVGDLLSQKTISSGPSQAPEKPTGARKSITEPENLAHGNLPVDLQPYITDKAGFEDGKAAVTAHEIDPKALALEVADKPRAITPKEIGALTYDRAKIIEAWNKVQASLKEGKGDAHVLINERDRLDDLLQVNTEALRKGGRENSAALNALKMGVSINEGNFAEIKAEAKIRKPNIGEKELGRIEEASRQVAERDARIKELEQENETLKSTSTAETTKRAPRKTYTKDDAQSEIQRILDEHKKAYIESQGALHANPIGGAVKLTAATLKAAGDIAHVYMKLGASSLEEVIGKTLAHFDHLPADERPTRQNIVDELGKTGKKATRSELDQQIASLKSQARNESTAGKAKIEAAIADLKNQIQTGEYRVPSKRELVVSDELKSLRTERQQWASKVNNQLKALEPKPFGQRLTHIQTEGVISSPNVFEKIPAGSFLNQAANLVNEPVGWAAGKLKVKGQRLADIAEREGKAPWSPSSGSGERLRTFYPSKEALKNAKTTIQTGVTPTSAILGDVTKAGPVSRLHGATTSIFMETPEFRASERARTDTAKSRGLDVSDPKVQESIRTASAMDAQNQIMRQKNALGSLIGETIRKGQTIKTNSPVTQFGIRTGATIAKFFVPVVNMALNVTGRALEFGGVGPAKAFIEHMAALKSKEPLTAAQADTIIRGYSRAGTAGIIAYACIKAPDEVQKMLDGLGLAGHGPLGDAFRYWLAATKGFNEEGASGAGTGLTKELAHNTPGFEGALSAGEALKGRGSPIKVATQVATTLNPGIVKWIAGFMDKGEAEDELKSNPSFKTFWDYIHADPVKRDQSEPMNIIKAGIPLMRPTVPAR